MVVMYSVGEMWRKWKSYVKKTFFLPHKDDEEFLLEQPADDRIQLDQWLELINTWKDSKMQDIAEQNSINVLKKKCLHRTGRTPFFILEEEMVGKGATQVANLDVWMESRSRGKGIQEDETTSDVYAQFTRALSKKPECERTREFKDELFFIAMGKEGRNHVRCAPRGSFINRHGTKFGLRDEGSFQDRQELLKLKDELIQKQDEVQQVKIDFINEKEKFVLEQEKLILEQDKTKELNKKLELFLTQFPSISSQLHGVQGTNALGLYKETPMQQEYDSSNEEHHAIGLRDITLENEQIVGDNFNEEADVNEYNEIKIGARVHLYCHGIPKKIVAEGVLVGYIYGEGNRPTFCKVIVRKALVKNEKLSKPRRDVVIVGQAINKCILWEVVNVEEG